MGRKGLIGVLMNDLQSCGGETYEMRLVTRVEDEFLVVFEDFHLGYPNIKTSGAVLTQHAASV